MLSVPFNTKTASFQSSSQGLKSAPISFGANYVAIILDEVALEGLDGITMPMLKYRLENRDEFRPTLSDDFIFEVLLELMKKDQVSCYKLQDPRPFVKPYDRYESADDEGLVVESTEESIDSYPFEIVCENGVVGSCSTFTTRKAVKGLTATDIDESIVFVANQLEREKAVLGSLYDPSLPKMFTPVQWSLLERVGRSRNQGETTIGKQSLKQTNISARDLFYHRKVMLKFGLITKQPFALISNNTAKPNAKGLLFHLPRFYAERRAKWQVMLYNLLLFLKTKPNGIATYEEIQEAMGSDYVGHKKFFKHPEVGLVIKVNLHVSYSALYPDSNPKSWTSKNGQERKVRVVQLIDVNINPEDVWVDKTEEMDLEDMDDDAYEESVSNLPKWTPNRTIIFRAYEILDEAGPQGISGTDFRKQFGVSKLSARSIIKYLERRGAVDTYLKESGKQKMSMLVAPRFKNKTALKQNVPKNFRSYHKESPGAKHILTERQLSRIHSIMEMVTDAEVVDDPSKIYRYVCNKEVEEGIGVRMDRKSFKRLLERLGKEGKLKIVKVSVE